MNTSRYDDFRADVRHWLESTLNDELREVTERANSVYIDKAHSLAWQRDIAVR